jgi:soluble lytic murein transglycosylase
VAHGSKKKGTRYGRSRDRRRRAATLLAVGLVALVGGLIALPYLLRAPDAVRQAVYPLRYEEIIREESLRYGLEPAFVAGVIYAESKFQPDATSPKGAYGLMQILPDTADFIAERSGIEGDFRDPETNLRMGIWYLDYLDGRYLSDERLMLAAYNSGEGRVDAWISDEGFDIGEDIPFQETREYVERVLEARQTYAELYGRNLDRRS